MPASLIETSNLSLATPSGRVLLRDLNLSLEAERVALIGRNGVGKSTLLEVLAGQQKPQSGRVVRRTTPYLVSQLQEPRGLSHGELRRQRLLRAQRAAPELLLLDEPTQDLDAAACAWLREWLRGWKGGALVASHDTALLRDFEHFFVLSESGCRYFRGALAELEVELEREQAIRESAYARNLHRMVEAAEHTETVARRRARKERYGRVRELDRGSPRVILNMKRNQAQVNHGKEKAAREARLDNVRQFAKASRRALQVELPLVLPVSGGTGGHPRVAVIGPNGSGKTTLLGSMGDGSARFGVIAQGAGDWNLAESLLDCLGFTDAPERLVAHRFPLALAQRPLRSLSPGERVRAALICLFQRGPEVLILDEPTYSLDLLGKRALSAALKAWPGGLVVASHDLEFLREIGVDEWIDLEVQPCDAPA